MLLIGLLIMPSFVLAATEYADSVESYAPGTQKNTDPLSLDRDDPAAALGAPDGNFVSLGYDGELVLKFDQNMSGILVITPWEVTNGSYPIEEAEVYASQNGVSWTLLGVANNQGTPENGNQYPTRFDLEDMCVQYIKLIDVTDEGLHNETSDGYDVDAVQIDYTEICQPDPEEDCDNCGSIKAPVKVMNNNAAVVMNSVYTSANTGHNSAQGGNGGQAGDGGNVIDSDDDNTGGNGGNGGNGGEGGQILTGTASATTYLANNVNDITTIVDPACGCDEACPCGKIDRSVRVINAQMAQVMSELKTKANTGGNRADGGHAGQKSQVALLFSQPVNGGYQPASGGNGGSVIDSDDDNIGGQGGHAGNGGLGGLISTAPAFSFTDVINRVNTIVTRINR